MFQDKESFIKRLNKEQKEFIDEIEGCDITKKSSFHKEFITDFKRGKYLKPSEFVEDKLLWLFDGYIPQRFKNALCYTLDKSKEWAYSESWYRRSFRSNTYYVERLFDIIYRFHRQLLIDKDVADILNLKLDKDEIDIVKGRITWDTFGINSYVIAYELDTNNKKVIKAVEDIVNGDGELPLQRYIIQGIVRSNNAKMHELLGKLLLAAGLQEGLRQTICENMDMGTVSAFLNILKVIEENNLIRFSSVKRAVGTWLGIIDGDSKSLERISDKSLKLITDCLGNRKCVDEYIHTDDCMKIYIGLWSVGVYNVEKAVEMVKDFSKNGTHNQILTAGYFCASLNNYSLEHELAAKVIAEHQDEQDILAVYMEQFMSHSVLGYGWDSGVEKEIEGDAECFADTYEAELYYKIMMYIYENIKGKSVDFSPCIFPWYSAKLKKMIVIERLCRIARYLGDSEKIDDVSVFLKDCESDMRARCLRILLSKPTSSIQKRAVTAMLCDRESYTRKVAADIVKSMQIEEENYLQMEEMLRYKASDMRAAIVGLLYTQSGDKLLGTIERLLADKKEEKRTAALDIVMQLSNDKGRKNVFEKAVDYVREIANPSSKEQVLISNILGTSETGSCERRKSLYDKADKYMPQLEEGEVLKKAVEVFMKYFPGSKLSEQIYSSAKKGVFGAIKGIIAKLNTISYEETKADCDSLLKLFCEHAHDEYRDCYGEMSVFGAQTWNFSEVLDDDKSEVPGLNIWKAWYEENIACPERLYRMSILLEAHVKGRDFDNEMRDYVAQIFGAGFEEHYECEFRRQIKVIVSRLIDEYIDKEEEYLLSVAIAYWYVKCLPQNMVLVKAIPPKEVQSWYGKLEAHFISHSQLAELFAKLRCNNDKFFNEVFPLSVLVAQKTFARPVKINENSDPRYHLNENQVRSPYSYNKYHEDYKVPGVMPYMIAVCRALISREAMYEYMFREDNLEETFEVVTLLGSGFRDMNRQVAKRKVYSWWHDEKKKQLMAEFMNDKNAQQFIDDVYEEIVNEVLSVELKRGDSETEYSADINSVKRIYGIDNFISILTALGKDTLERTSYYANSKSKKGSMSHLLSVCIPYETDNANDLKEALSKTDIKEKRLVEATLYSPEWIDIVGEYLGYEDFKSVCYYFMAHMNEDFDDIRKAIIARYTPLSAEQLNDGAFDINWFKGAYEKIGAKKFDLVYDAAKYISDGAKHVRARKYADATLGKMDINDVETMISEKRNKDLVMAYSLIPIDDEEDIVRRYLFLQNFVKESRKFGAQRIASEKKAAEISLKNLSINAGYSDVTRLSLRMETKLIDDIRDLFEEHNVEDVIVKLHVDENGKADIICKKEEKILKSVPARLKKNEYIVRLNENKKKLNEQFKRTKLMFEQAMEEETEFLAEEIEILHNNPVANAVVRSLLFVSGEKVGFIEDGKLVDYAGYETTLLNRDIVKVAHPYHLYTDGHWTEYQKVLFDKQIVQVFKQVFRELYVKTEEELEMNYSRRYSGNQIQPQKTVACLKGRRWVADVEDGLQKVYYKENVIARIYAMTDWFSPSDIEAPTLEWVEFSDRRTGKEIKIKDVKNVIFSEVMRDVDLAVSVAHAGGVDPQTSHSTVEMRAALLSFILPLFKLNNVRIQANHAIVEGHYGTYDINLGSGVIHKSGGAMIIVLPVHSQHRGKIFLPFADDDPKTAEIITKVIMFAEDKKIKDVSILEQIR